MTRDCDMHGLRKCFQKVSTAAMRTQMSIQLDLSGSFMQQARQ